MRLFFCTCLVLSRIAAAPHSCLPAGTLASQLGIPRAAAARNVASYFGGSDAETLSSRGDWSEGEALLGCTGLDFVDEPVALMNLC